MADGDAGAGAGAGGGADAAAAAAAAGAGKPWYDGKADAETIGYWQNKAWKHDDPVTVALEATKAAREAQKFVGVPADQIIRLPKDAKDEAGWKDVWSRLGTPKEAKDYDFTNVKSADGTAIDQAFADTIRKAAFELHIPKDAATGFAQSIVKHIDSQKESAALEAKTKWEAGVANIKKSWGTNEDVNKLTALQGAKRLGISQEQYDQMAKAVGVDVTAEMFRRIGAGTSEDTFVDGGNNAPKTVASAQSRLNELMSDQAWAKRLLAGDVAARREYEGLTEQIAGVSANAA